MVATKARVVRATRANVQLPKAKVTQLGGKPKGKGVANTGKNEAKGTHKDKGEGAAADETVVIAAQTSLTVYLKLMRATFNSVLISLGELESADKAVELMREFLDAIQVKLKGNGKDLGVEQLAEAGEQAVEQTWIDMATTKKGDLSAAMVALNLAATQTQITAAKVEKEATDDNEGGDEPAKKKKKKGKDSPATKAVTKAAAADAKAAEEARKVKDLSDKRKADEARKKRKAMEDATEHAEPEKMREFLKMKGVRGITKEVLTEGGTIMEIMDACNFEQQKKLLSLAVLFDFGHASSSTEDSEDEGEVGGEGPPASDKRGAAGQGSGKGGEDVSIVAPFSIESMESQRVKVTAIMLANARELKQFIDAATKSAARGENTRKQYMTRLKEFEGENYLSLETYRAAKLMSVRDESEMQVARAIKSAQCDAFAATATIIENDDFKACDMLKMDSPSACAAHTLACESVRYGGVAVALDRNARSGGWKEFEKSTDYVLGMLGNPLLLECAHVLGLVALAFGQVLSSAKAVMPDMSEAGLVERLTSLIDPTSALYRAQTKMQMLAQAEGEHASQEQLAELPVMKRAVEVITALVKVVYKHFPSSKRAALAASFGLCVATGLLPVSERSIKKAMTLMTDMRGAYASSFAFITTDPLDEQTLKRLEATFLAAVGRKPGVARLLEPVKPPAARKSGTGEGKGPKAAAAASGRTEVEADDEEDDPYDGVGGAGDVGGAGGAAGGGDDEREIMKRELFQLKGVVLYKAVVAKGKGGIGALLTTISAATKCLNGPLRTEFEAANDVALGEKACPSCLKPHLVLAPCLHAQARAVVIAVSEQIKPGGFQQAKVMLAKPPQKGETFEAYVKRVNLPVSKKGQGGSADHKFSRKRKRGSQ